LLCRKGFNLGDSFLWRDNDKSWVFNLGTQEYYWRCRASYDAIKEALKKMKVRPIRKESEALLCPGLVPGTEVYPGRRYVPLSKESSTIGQGLFTFTKSFF
jgi:hypothetical protein